MKTIDEVFELIEIREDAGDAVLSWRIGPAWKLSEAEKVYVEATKELRTAIEELHRDAAQASKLRDAVKFLLGTTVPATGQQEQCWIALTDAMKEST